MPRGRGKAGKAEKPGSGTGAGRGGGGSGTKLREDREEAAGSMARSVVAGSANTQTGETGLGGTGVVSGQALPAGTNLAGGSGLSTAGPATAEGPTFTEIPGEFFGKKGELKKSGLKDLKEKLGEQKFLEMFQALQAKRDKDKAEAAKAKKEEEKMSAAEFAKLAETVSAQNVSKKMASLYEDNVAYPEKGVGWEHRGTQHSDIPLCMFKNGNDVEKCGISHPEKDQTGRTKRVRITERKTTPAQVRTGEAIWDEGHMKERGDVTACVKPFGKAVKITPAERGAMSAEEKQDMANFEMKVKEMCESADEGEQARGEWLRDNVVGNWVFMVDGNSRLEGYNKGRKKDRERGIVKTDVYFSTILVRLNAKNMETVCSLSRHINDNNIELNSRKSLAQEVAACYEINDMQPHEMEKTVSKEMLQLYSTHTGRPTGLRKDMQNAGVNYPGLVFAVALKPNLGLLLMSEATLLLPKGHVGELGTKKVQWALKRVHVANMSKEKRVFWEPVWDRWVMLENPDDTVPDLDCVDALYLKHLPVDWDAIFVKQCEMSAEEYKKLTGLVRGRNQMIQFIKWMAWVFSACDAAVELLISVGFYKKMEKRKRGESPVLAEEYLEYAGACDVFEFGKALIWMETSDPETRPFWWAHAEKVTEVTMAPIRDRLLLSYFRTVLPSRLKEVKETELAGLAKKDSLFSQVLPHFAVLPVPKLKDRLLTNAGFIKPTSLLVELEEQPDDLDRSFSSKKVCIYGPFEIEHLRSMRTSWFRELVKGARWDVDSGGVTPTVRVWDKGAEPRTLEKKRQLPEVPYLPAAKVEKAVKPPSSFTLWEKKRLLQIRPEQRLCLHAVQSDEPNPGVANEKFPSLEEVVDRLTWVTSSSTGFDPEARPVHLVLYLVACAQENPLDCRPVKESVQTALELMAGLMQFKECIGVAVVPGNTPPAWVPASLEIAALRFITFTDQDAKGEPEQKDYKKFGDPGTTYLVLYLAPTGAGADQEVPDQSKKYGLNVQHKKFRLAGTAVGVVPDNAEGAVAVVLGEENGCATITLLQRNVQVVSVLSRRLDKWEGAKGRRINSTPLTMTFVERAKASRAGTLNEKEFGDLPGGTVGADSDEELGTGTQPGGGVASAEGLAKTNEKGKKKVTDEEEEEAMPEEEAGGEEAEEGGDAAKSKNNAGREKKKRKKKGDEGDGSKGEEKTVKKRRKKAAKGDEEEAVEKADAAGEGLESGGASARETTPAPSDSEARKFADSLLTVGSGVKDS